ncbi:hypothetical protein CW304_04750 [Bacillus sp. UFRGS-B20]|nr:hypothetical protein CW304_04750 [Bacillus sp. UFRGS-B20]
MKFRIIFLFVYIHILSLYQQLWSYSIILSMTCVCYLKAILSHHLHLDKKGQPGLIETPPPLPRQMVAA